MYKLQFNIYLEHFNLYPLLLWYEFGRKLHIVGILFAHFSNFSKLFP